MVYLKRKIDVTCKIMPILLWIVFMGAGVSAELRVDSVSPVLGTAGQDLEVTLTGTGFNENTRVSIALDVTNKKDIIGSVDTPGYAFEVVVTGNRAYIADNDSGLQVIDISDPTRPRIIGSVDTPGYAYGVAITGNRAYVADGWSGLQVIDISDSSNPTIIGSVDTPYYASEVVVIGNKAYVANYWSGLQVIDISDPARPRRMDGSSRGY